MASIGSGAVVFLHGAGLDPRLFDAVMQLMPTPTIAPTRSPYEERTSLAVADVSSVAAQALDVLGRLDPWARAAGAADGPVAVVGVSGGATIGLAMAIAIAAGTEPSRPVAAFVLHEPLIGPLARDLHERVSTAAEQLAAEPSSAGIETFLAGLVGETTWSELPATAHDFARRHHRTVRAEVGSFVAFEPSAAELAAIRCDRTTSDTRTTDRTTTDRMTTDRMATDRMTTDRMTTDGTTSMTISVGSQSGPHRHAAAEVVCSLTGCGRAIVSGAGHLAHVEHPIEFERMVAATLCPTEARR